MPTTFKVKRSITPGNSPSGLADGEIAVNTVDKKIWVANSTAAVLIYDNSAAGGSVTIKETEINITIPTSSTKFTITDASVSPSSKIIANQSGAAATGRLEDENELTNLALSAVSGTGVFTLYVKCTTGAAYGKFKINYLIG